MVPTKFTERATVPALQWVNNLDLHFESGKADRKIHVIVPFATDAINKIFFNGVLGLSKCLEGNRHKSNISIASVQFVIRQVFDGEKKFSCIDGGFLYFGGSGEEANKVTVFVANHLPEEIDKETAQEKCDSLARSVMGNSSLKYEIPSKGDFTQILEIRHTEDMLCDFLIYKTSFIFKGLIKKIKNLNTDPKLCAVVINIRSRWDVCERCVPILRDNRDRIAFEISKKVPNGLSLPQSGVAPVVFRVMSDAVYGSNREYDLSAAKNDTHLKAIWGNRLFIHSRNNIADPILTQNFQRQEIPYIKIQIFSEAAMLDFLKSATDRTNKLYAEQCRKFYRTIALKVYEEQDHDQAYRLFGFYVEKWKDPYILLKLGRMHALKKNGLRPKKAKDFYHTMLREMKELVDPGYFMDNNERQAFEETKAELKTIFKNKNAKISKKYINNILEELEWNREDFVRMLER